MKKLLLFAGCMVGMLLTGCQKDVLPESPALPEQSVAPAATGLSFSPTSVTLALLGGERSQTIVAYWNGSVDMLGQGNGRVWLEAASGSPDFLDMVSGPNGSSANGWPYLTVRIKDGARLGHVVRGYMYHQNTLTGVKTLVATITAQPAPEI